MHGAYFAAAGVGLVELFLLGVFLGAISRERLWLYGLRLTFAGVIALVISFLLGGGVG
jgi:VIT1/CCC1 family predicted Fe2+/Mn2+ transporter